MRSQWNTWRERIVSCLTALAPDADPAEIDRMLTVATPPGSDKGDIAFPMFPYARLLRNAPARIAARVADAVEPVGGRAVADGPYVNVFLERGALAVRAVQAALDSGASWGDTRRLADARVMIEFSSPNTNKPLHLGHLRNDSLGESVARLLAAAGARVHRVNIVNDRGVHICRSMLAYRQFGNGATPESTGKKPDHFVGDYYVRYAAWEREQPEVARQAQAMLRDWEAGDPQTVALWKTMNGWATAGIQATYRRTGIAFDRIYYESETYKLGAKIVLEGLDRGLFYRDERDTVWCDLTDVGLDKKVLLRGDGTSLYLTQDLGTAVQRYEDWPFDRMIYVVGSEQRYHFKVLFEVLGRLGVAFAGHVEHLSYGMVNLTDGRMKSREGTVVDADDLIDRLAALAREAIVTKERDAALADVHATCEAIALGALHYYLLQHNPGKDMVFDPAQSLAFNGNTGPYLQYLGARVSSMLRKHAAPDRVDSAPIATEEEWLLVRSLADYPDAVADAALAANPAALCTYLYESARVFSRLYHDHPIAVAADPEQRAFRLALSKAVMNMVRHGLDLLNIPFLESM